MMTRTVAIVAGMLLLSPVFAQYGPEVMAWRTCSRARWIDLDRDGSHVLTSGSETDLWSISNGSSEVVGRWSSRAAISATGDSYYDAAISTIVRTDLATRSRFIRSRLPWRTDELDMGPSGQQLVARDEFHGRTYLAAADRFADWNALYEPNLLANDLFATWQGNTVVVRKLTTGELIKEIPSPIQGKQVAASSDFSMVAVHSLGNTIALIDGNGALLRNQFFSPSIVSVLANPQLPIFALEFSDGTFGIYDASAGTLAPFALPKPGGGYSYDWSLDGRHLGLATWFTPWQIRGLDGKLEYTPAHSALVQPGLQPSGQVAAATDTDQIELFDLPTLTYQGSRRGPRYEDAGLSVSLTYSRDFSVGLGRRSDGKVVLAFADETKPPILFPDTPPIDDFAFTPDGSRLCTRDDVNRRVYVWRTADRSLIWSAPTRSGWGALAFSDDGTLVLANGTVYRVGTSQTSYLTNDRIRYAQFSQDGSSIVFSTDRIWKHDLRTHQTVALTNSSWGVEFDVDESRGIIAVIANFAIRLIRLDDGNELGRIGPQSGFPIRDVEFGPGGDILLARSSMGSLLAIKNPLSLPRHVLLNAELPAVDSLSPWRYGLAEVIRSGSVVESVGLAVTDGQSPVHLSTVGAIQLRLKIPGWLTATVVPAGDDTASVRLYGGDFNGDNRVDQADYLVFAQLYELAQSPDADVQSTGATGHAALDADFDGDQQVTVFDYAVICDAFGRTGT